MRLLEVNQFPPPVPEDKLTDRPYAILSHVWEEEELTFRDLHNPQHAISLQTRNKIRGAQKQARKDGLDYIWIDTACIDKSSSAELGEAINSMYRWYKDAEVCYVYLADLEGCTTPLKDTDIRHGGQTVSKQHWSVDFRESKWFQRGWTLQELIAPSKLRFYDRDWNLVGDLRDLALTVSEITGIHLSMLHHAESPKDFSIAQRMCWAAGRETTRPEDKAYSLLGLLDMSIDIRYGEGSKAFIRLQEAIIERSADQSIFAWEKHFVQEEDLYLKEQRRDSYLWDDNEWTYLLAPSPDAFAGAHNIVPSSQPSLPYRINNMGLHITAQVEKQNQNWILLNCYSIADPTKAILLNVRTNRAYAQHSKHVTVGHVWLRKKSPGQKLSPISRLSLMNADEAVASTEPHELFIATSRASSGMNDSMQRHYNIWLQMLDAGKQDSLVFEASEPKLNNNIDSYTWSLEKEDESPTLRPSSLVISMLHPSEKVIDLRLTLFPDHAEMRLETCRCPDTGHELQHNVLGHTSIWFGEGFNKDQKVELKLIPGLAICASIHRQYLHDQKWHIIKVWTEHSDVHFRQLKALWASVKSLNCGSVPENG